MDEIRVLLFNISPDMMDLAGGLLSRPPFLVEMCTQATDLQQRVNQTAYKMILLNLPSAGMEPRDILYTLRNEKRPSSKSVLIILAPPDRIAEYRSYLSKGVSALFAHGSRPQDVEDVIARLTQVSPRVDSRIMVRLKAKLQQTKGPILCQAMNLSMSGMFVTTAMKFPVDSEVLFELLLPQNRMALNGEGKVIRHALGSRDRADGMGILFVSFKADGQKTLKTFIEQKLPPTA
jgi:Tfp pilus assembly protein PilZ